MNDDTKLIWSEISETKKDVKDIDKRIRDISENMNRMMPVVDRMDKSIDKHEVSEEIRLKKIQEFDVKLENITVQLETHVKHYEQDKSKKKWHFEQLIAVLAIVIATVSVIINFT